MENDDLYLRLSAQADELRRLVFLYPNVPRSELFFMAHIISSHGVPRMVVMCVEKKKRLRHWTVIHAHWTHHDHAH